MVIWEDADGISVRTENGGVLETTQTGIPIGTPVLLAYNHDLDKIEHVWRHDDKRAQEYPEILDELKLEDIPGDGW